MNNFEILKRLYRDYTKKFRHKILLSIFFTSLVAGATASIAYLLDPAIEKLFVEKDQTLLLIIPALIIFSFALKGSSLYLAKVIMISVAEDIRAIIQADMVNSLIEADTDYIDDKHTGKFISNLTYDTGLITNLVSTAILNFFKDSLTLIALLGVMFFQNWKLSLFAIIMIPLSSFVAKNLGKRIGKVTNEAQIFSGILTSHFIEIFKNHKIIKIFQQEENEKSKLVIFIDDLKEKVKKISIIYVRATPIMETLTGIMIAGLIFYSGKLILRNEIEINNFFSFLAAMMLAYQPVRSLATLNMTINQGLSAAKRILPIIDNKKEISENKNSFQLEIDKGNIKFENVTFGYKTDPRNVLKSINLEIIGGKMNALVGHSGAGKTTILNLIPRFFNCKDGDILIDNQSIYNVTVKSLRKNISLVSQDTTLFDNTIRNNISYANIKASDEEIIEASKKAEAHDFIEKLPYKYDTQIGEDGVRLSGGEKQRLSIARAILKKTPIILLDEATSSLDAVSLKILGGKMTSIVGHSGAGKSTILNLIPRFYDVNSGNIEIDNQSIYNSTINSLRKNISLVSQDTTLFDDTIRNNIAYANLNAKQEEIEEAAENSYASEFIEKLPNKYETIIGENGTRLSGGEKQRLSIARAMLKKSQIILLDEATSSLDAETESKIQEAINFLTKNRTTIVIAHRLSTILSSDKIYVIDSGNVVGEGTHEQLLINSTVYKNFYEKQIRKV